jgi:uncharacterized protein (TIGR02391 family)
MNKRRIEKLKNLLEELVPDQIDFQLYTEILESQWDTDTFFRGKVLALHSYLKLLRREDLSASLNDFMPISGNAIEALTFISDHITPEILDYLEREANADENDLADHFWDILHPRVATIAKPRFDSGFYSDSVEAAFKEINVIIKTHFKQETNIELDGAKLMSRAFSKDNPVFTLADTSTMDGKNVQQGYMNLFLGSIIGIRNPSAHGNEEMERIDAIHFLFLASLLLRKFDTRI